MCVSEIYRQTGIELAGNAYSEGWRGTCGSLGWLIVRQLSGLPDQMSV